MQDLQVKAFSINKEKLICSQFYEKALELFNLVKLIIITNQ